MARRSLEEFVEEVNGSSHLRIEYDFGDGFVRLHTSEAERRQAAQDIRSSEDILIELLRNARDAHAGRIFVAVGKSGDKRTITVVDDGDGIPANMHRHIFEPRVTSKLDTAHQDKWGIHGRGMALFSVSQNADSARVVASAPSLGSSIQVISNTSKLTEKADQSSFPTFILNEQGSIDVRGPKNLVRIACEFAIEERASCMVAIGSATEILAAMYQFGSEHLSSVDRLFCKDAEKLPIAKRLATAADTKAFSRIATNIGFEVSERSARRIMDGEIDPAPSILERITIQNVPGKDKKPASSTRTPKLARIRFSEEDLCALSNAVSAAYADLADTYYLNPDIDPEIRSKSGKLTITIPLVGRE